VRIGSKNGVEIVFPAKTHIFFLTLEVGRAPQWYIRAWCCCLVCWHFL